MTEVEYEKVIIEVPAYIEEKTGTNHKTSRCTSEVQCECECQLITIPPIRIEC